MNAAVLQLLCVAKCFCSNAGKNSLWKLSLSVFVWRLIPCEPRPFSSLPKPSSVMKVSALAVFFPYSEKLWCP